MNRRQRKKQFKKKYGMTPAKAIDLFSDTIRHLNDDIIPQVMESVIRCVNEMADWAENYLPKIMEEVNGYVREHSAGIEEAKQDEALNAVANIANAPTIIEAEEAKDD